MNDSQHSNGIDRRTFVQGAAALTAAGAISMPSSRARAAAIDSEQPLKVALIGCGGRGTGAAFQALNADPGVVIHAMADVFPEQIERARTNLRNAVGSDGTARVDVPEERSYIGFDAYKKVMASDVDVVILTTPPGFRPEMLEAAVEAGKHVFLEKPMAVDAVGVRRCLDACAEAKARNLSVVAGFCWRYDKGMMATFDKINDGGIGKILSCHTTYHSGTLRQIPREDHMSDMEFQLRNWWHYTWLSGDHLAEQACHSVDRLSWAMGDRDPVRCTALGGRAAREGAGSGHVYDHFTVVYEYADGARAHHTCRQIDGTPSDNSDYIYGSKGTAEVNGWKPIFDLRDHDGNTTWSFEGDDRDMYQYEHDVLFRSIREGRGHNDGEWMMRSTLMSIMGRMAAYTGQVVTWEQAMKSAEDLMPKTIAWGPMPEPTVAVPGRTKLV